MKSKIRILIVDDHFMARLGLAVPINGEPDMTVIAETDTAADALLLYRSHQPDVVLMDYRLHGESGVDAARNIRAEFPSARILMLTALEGEEDIHRAAGAGVCGYLSKQSRREEVLGAIRRVHAGEHVFPAAIAAKLRARERRDPLIPREIEILHHIVQGRSNKEIAAALKMSESLIKHHVRKILEKLAVPDRTRAATLAIERGIVPVR